MVAISWNSGSPPGQPTSLMRQDHMLRVTKDWAQIGSFTHFLSSFLTVKAVVMGPDQAFLPPFLCSLIFCPEKEGKSTFPSCLLFTAMLPPAVFLSPYKAPVLEPPFCLWGGEKKNRQQKEQQWWPDQLTPPFPGNLKNTSKSSILYVANIGHQRLGRNTRYQIWSRTFVSFTQTPSVLLQPRLIYYLFPEPPLESQKEGGGENRNRTPRQRGRWLGDLHSFICHLLVHILFIFMHPLKTERNENQMYQQK